LSFGKGFGPQSEQRDLRKEKYGDKRAKLHPQHLRKGKEGKV